MQAKTQTLTFNPNGGTKLLLSILRSPTEGLTRILCKKGTLSSISLKIYFKVEERLNRTKPLQIDF